MLMLSRKVGEKIQIGDGITITILDKGSKRVRIGVEAPADVKILRGELLPVPAAMAGASGDLEGEDSSPTVGVAEAVDVEFVALGSSGRQAWNTTESATAVV